jgi:Uma2 family endonuclease
MELAKLKTKISIEDYLKGELLSEMRREFIYGEVFAMAGASDRHNIISGNIFGNLWTHLQNSPCQVFSENMKLKADAQTFYYPDVMVICDESPVSSYYREEPILLVEVLSPTTERADRNEKLTVYKNIPSLREYLIVSQEKILVEVHRKLADETWQTEIYDEIDGEVTLDSIEYTLRVSEIYRRVNFQNLNDSFPQ